MKVFTIVVTYNAEKYLDGCIGGLLNSSLEHEIIVVDNQSTDDTVQSIKEKYSKIILLEQPENLGFGKANNVGINYALDRAADYIFLLNQDAYVYHDTVSDLVECFNKVSDSFGMLSPLHLDGGGQELDYVWKDYYLTPKTCPAYFDDLSSGELKEIYPIDFVNAAAWMLSAECVRAVGGFNSFFFMYAEDDDYIRRLKYKGYDLGFCPNSKIKHLRFATSNKPEDVKTKKYLMRKYYFGSAVILMDPARKMNAVFFKLVWMSMRRSFWSLRKAKFKECFFHVFLPFRLLANWFDLRKHRNESKKKELSHLTI